MTFSEGNMLLGEIYMSLAYGLIDPTCLPATTIVHHDNKIWCTDTRRLTIAKELLSAPEVDEENSETNISRTDAARELGLSSLERG